MKKEQIIICMKKQDMKVSLQFKKIILIKFKQYKSRNQSALYIKDENKWKKYKDKKRKRWISLSIHFT